MKYIKKLEALVEGWLKKAPHLPKNVQKWLAENVWWIALIGAIAYGISILVGLSTLAFLGSVSNTLYYVPGFATWTAITTVLNLVFAVLIGLLLAMSVNPLKAMTKKGWTLLFTVLLVNIVNVVISLVISFAKSLTLSGLLGIGGLIFGLIFSAIFVAIAAYFLFEIRSKFAHTTKAAKKS